MDYNLRSDREYTEAGLLEDRLRNLVDDQNTPGWLYDASGLGGIIDDLNRARFEYENRRLKADRTARLNAMHAGTYRAGE